MARLRDGANPRQAAERRIGADQARARAVLATAPHPSPASRSVDGCRHELHREIDERLADLRRQAAEAAQRAEAAGGRLRLVDLLLPTAAAKEAARLREEAAATAWRAELADDYRGQDHRDANARARDLAEQRRRKQAQWEERPDVQEARETERLNTEMATAIRAGDPEVTALAADGDIDRARDEIRRREDDARLERESMERDLHQAPGTPPKPK